MKFLQFACFFVALFAITYAANSRWGSRRSGDVLLMNEWVKHNGSAGAYTSINVNFPKSGQVNKRNITAIFVYDKYPRQSGAYANLWSGGPGYRFATINLKSQYGKGINSTVEIYGR